MIIQTALTQLYPHNAQNRKMHSCAEEMVAYFKDEKLFTALGFQPMTHETLMDWLKEIPAERKGRREQTRTGAGDDPTGGDGDAAISPLDALLDEYLDEWKKQSEAKVAAKTAPVDPVRARNAEEVVACANRGRKRPATVSLLGDDEEEEEEQSPSASGKGSKPRNALAKFDQLGEGLLELTAQSNDIRKDETGFHKEQLAQQKVQYEHKMKMDERRIEIEDRRYKDAAAKEERRYEDDKQERAERRAEDLARSAQGAATTSALIQMLAGRHVPAPTEK